MGNLCATCGTYWACHACHDEGADHSFGRVERDHPAAMECGVCGTQFGLDALERAYVCPGCGHPFNPGCASHRHLYFND